jgi:hypothetical protein
MGSILSTNGPSDNPGTIQTQPANQLLGIIGLSTMVTGVALMGSWPEGETWKLNGDDYCYSEGSNEINFERKTCGVTKPVIGIKPGLVIVGAGAVMTWLGYRRVTVNPQIDKNTVAATATITW